MGHRLLIESICCSACGTFLRSARLFGVREPGVWITFFALVLPVWAGAGHAITSQLELERVAERSARMSSALAGLAQRAGRALTHEELAETAREASGLMLRETHEWWVLLSFQGARLHV